MIVIKFLLQLFGIALLLCLIFAVIVFALMGWR
jgi:hypothetical protein